MPNKQLISEDGGFSFRVDSRGEVGGVAVHVFKISVNNKNKPNKIIFLKIILQTASDLNSRYSHTVLIGHSWVRISGVAHSWFTSHFSNKRYFVPTVNRTKVLLLWLL